MDRYQITFNTWDKIASLYQEHFMNLDLYNDTYDAFCNALPMNAAVLEIGCGPGNITKYLLNKRSDITIDATDISLNMIALAKQNNPAADCFVLDARDIGSISKTYHGILCGFCIPYLSKEDVIKFVNDCTVRLQPGGILYLSFIEGRYNQSGFETGSSGDKAYVYYYEEAYLQTLLQPSFTNTRVIKKPYPKKNGITDTHTIMISKKK